MSVRDKKVREWRKKQTEEPTVNPHPLRKDDGQVRPARPDQDINRDDDTFRRFPYIWQDP